MEQPGVSFFLRDGDAVFHTYSVYPAAPRPSAAPTLPWTSPLSAGRRREEIQGQGRRPAQGRTQLRLLTRRRPRRALPALPFFLRNVAVSASALAAQSSPAQPTLAPLGCCRARRATRAARSAHRHPHRQHRPRPLQCRAQRPAVHLLGRHPHCAPRLAGKSPQSRRLGIAESLNTHTMRHQRR
jgi:hypothetical protein